MLGEAGLGAVVPKTSHRVLQGPQASMAARSHGRWCCQCRDKGSRGPGGGSVEGRLSFRYPQWGWGGLASPAMALASVAF